MSNPTEDPIVHQLARMAEGKRNANEKLKDWWEWVRDNEDYGGTSFFDQTYVYDLVLTSSRLTRMIYAYGEGGNGDRIRRIARLMSWLERIIRQFVLAEYDKRLTRSKHES